MNLRQLEVFVAVAETESFSKGAENTLLTQSTVSQHIAALEDEMGLKLFDRTGRGALPTTAGKLFLQHAYKVLTELRQLKTAMNRFRGLQEVTLSVGGSNIPAAFIIPSTLPELAARFPGITVSLRHGDSRDILEKLEREEIEVGVVGSRYTIDSCNFFPLGNDRLRLVVSPDHPWGSRDQISLEELCNEPLLLREAGSGSGKVLQEALVAAGIRTDQLSIRARLGSNEAVKQAVVCGLGVSFLSELSVRRELQTGDLHAIDVTGLQVERRFYLVSRSNRELSPAAKAFSHLLQELYGEGSPATKGP
ncbi:MAG: LysR family transcriptional regulator [Desulfuromonas sp.]|nr:MAG: LysR family transcriptional regulator [Desulfuromonas sp.]